METKPFITTDWKQGTRALVGQEGRQQLSFDSTGLPTDPLTVTLTREGERVSVSVDMAGKGGVWVREGVGAGKSGAVRVDIGWRRRLRTKNKKKHEKRSIKKLP